MSIISLNRSQVRRPDFPVPGKPIISVRGAEVSFGDRRILAGIDLDINCGEVLAIVGPNGAGKSTLVNVVTADVELDVGKVYIDDEVEYSWSTRELAMRRAVLLQDIGLAFPFTVLEVVEMGRSPWAGLRESQHDDLIVSGAMSRTETVQFAARKFTSLSGGEKARVALARVLAQATPALLLDEPTAPMDIRHQELVLQQAKDYAATGGAVVIIVHNLDIAGAYADRIAMISDGSIIAQGQPSEVLTADLISSVYDYPVTIVADPNTGAPLVVPVRAGRKESPC
ncbi:heme ABC transporter ATP-binding protein [Brevibacterium aurantiacum]|uniref:Heme ABC transporter ATP-binding protein n=1 Tax=Brevibacterium aurantiacum TaxID=273384 RepID=A0A556CAT5_BREAU|nr:heme ABC transporter ATP-binding protein [Brevibacterium aurantiacum]TSI14561.1 heme ABC transporter ATP-binding protein [Brevibacterium aurantiacum]